MDITEGLESRLSTNTHFYADPVNTASLLAKPLYFEFAVPFDFTFLSLLYGLAKLLDYPAEPGEEIIDPESATP
jgi:hypothetical protein